MPSTEHLTSQKQLNNIVDFFKVLYHGVIKRHGYIYA